MNIYHYNETGEFIASGIADPNPMKKDGWLLPANSTSIAPPTTRNGEVAVFKHNVWSIVEDNRGLIVFDSDGNQKRLTELGPVPADYTLAPPPGPISELREQALSKIDTDAEEARKQFATPGSLQAMVYLEKAEEARAYQAATNPIDADYPFLKAEADALAMDIADFAALVLQNRDAWTTAAADIEAIRATAKAAVRTAPDQSAIDTILNGLNWPTPQ